MKKVLCQRERGYKNLLRRTLLLRNKTLLGVFGIEKEKASLSPIWAIGMLFVLATEAKKL